ncbi:MAG: hypothetical protein RL536_370 [Candidatus Parcubacteria bacterium]|jgi:hypothetical protein
MKIAKAFGMGSEEIGRIPKAFAILRSRVSQSYR